MSEKVSVLFALPSGSADTAAVQEALRGISAQTYPSSLIEVVQVQYASGVPGGQTSALNAARESASGTFVVQTEPGVVWDGNKLERQVSQLQSRPSAGACVHRMIARDAAGKTQAMDLADVRRYGFRIGCLLRSPWGPGAAMLQKEAMAQVGMYRNVGEVLWEYAVRLIDQGHDVALLDEDLAVWNLGEEAPRARTRVPLFPEQVRHPFLKSYLDRMRPEKLFPASEAAGKLVMAGLYQNNDDLEVSHRICQEVGAAADCPEASYWHGMVHRREPDFSNARGWFQKAAGLAALPEIHDEVVRFLQRVLQVPEYGAAREKAFRFLQHLQSQGTWDPFYYTELCQAYRQDADAEDRRLLAEIQELEFCALFDWTYRLAVGN